LYEVRKVREIYGMKRVAKKVRNHLGGEDHFLEKFRKMRKKNAQTPRINTRKEPLQKMFLN
jgi:hypothetical protein